MPALSPARSKIMPYAIDASMPTPAVASRLELVDSQRLPVPQALAVIAALASSLWLGIGAVVLWLAGWWPLMPG